MFRKAAEIFYCLTGVHSPKQSFSGVFEVICKDCKNYFSSPETDVLWSGTFNVTSTSDVKTEHVCSSCLSVWSESLLVGYGKALHLYKIGLAMFTSKVLRTQLFISIS